MRSIVALRVYLTTVSRIRVIANKNIMTSSECWPISRMTIYCISKVLGMNLKFKVAINWKQEWLCIVLIGTTWIPWNSSETTKYFIACWFNYCYSGTFIVTIRMKAFCSKSVFACSVQKRYFKILLRLFNERCKFLPVTFTLENHRILEIWSNQ